mmetsp:Transcript_9796/g.28924  ORF Transcript_9796/g.28924 Transcript_9796/m.28924 type:complete len:288 (+) Transcript_9796:759-1622(+)
MQDSGAGVELRPASGVQGLQAVAGAAPHAQLNLVVVAAAAAAARAAAAFARGTDAVGRPPGRHRSSAPQPHVRAAAARRQGLRRRAASRGRALQQRGGAAEAAAARPGAGEADAAAARPLVPKQAVPHLPQATRADQGEPRQQHGRRRQQPRPAAAAVWRRRHPTAAAPRLDRRHDRRGDGGVEQHPHGWRLRRVVSGANRKGYGRPVCRSARAAVCAGAKGGGAWGGGGRRRASAHRRAGGGEGERRRLRHGGRRGVRARLHQDPLDARCEAADGGGRRRDPAHND